MGIGNDILTNTCHTLEPLYRLSHYTSCQVYMGTIFVLLVRQLKHKELKLFMKDTTIASGRIKM